MKRISVLSMMIAAAALLCSCGSGNNGSVSADTTAATSAETTTSVEEKTSAENETEEQTENEQTAQGNFDYPESIMSANPPYPRNNNKGENLVAAIPGIYDDHLIRGGTSNYMKFEKDDNTYFMYVTSAGWTTDVPPWMEADSLNYTLDEAPAFMYSTFIEVLDDGPFMVNHTSPFSMTKTEVTVDTDEHIEIDGKDFIRQSGIAHGEKYGQEGTAYFTVYYGISDVNFTTINGENVYDPYMVIAFTGDLSDEGKQIVNVSADYAMTHSDLVKE